MTLQTVILAIVLAGCASCGGSARACEALNRFTNNPEDASSALADCLKRLPPRGQLALSPGTYRLTHLILIDKAITVTTAGLSQEQRGCADLPRRRCATLLIDPQAAAKSRAMPVLVAADGVILIHLIIQGAGATPQRRSDCRSPESRPLGGGLRVSSSGFVLSKSVLRGFACYSGLEITSGASHPTISDNVIGPNGDHDSAEIWSDGVTIHDSDHAVITRNVFVDNTDVQLILGGCRDCRIQANRFRHSKAFGSASFAELMLQAWPNTSGDYAGTLVTGNSIDCGNQRRCGYGIMVGSAPWYDGSTSGGAIIGNSVTNAMLAINVDALSGPVEIRSNNVRNAGGFYSSDCGFRNWPAVNVAPSSRRYVRGGVANVAIGSVSTRRCLLNRRAT